MAAAPVRVWRISNYDDLNGLGGLRAGGRWHSRGRQIVYCSEHPAAALLEILVHLDIDLMPEHFQLIEIAPEAGLDCAVLAPAAEHCSLLILAKQESLRATW